MSDPKNIDIDVLTYNRHRTPPGDEIVRVNYANDGTVTDTEIQEFNERNRTIGGVETSSGTIRQRGITRDTHDPTVPISGMRSQRGSVKTNMEVVDSLAPHVPIVNDPAEIGRLPEPLRNMAITVSEWHDRLDELLDGTNMEAESSWEPSSFSPSDSISIYSPPERCCQASEPLPLNPETEYTTTHRAYGGNETYCIDGPGVDCPDCGKLRMAQFHGAYPKYETMPIRDLSKPGTEPTDYWVRPTPEHIVTAALKRRTREHAQYIKWAERHCAFGLERLTQIQPAPEPSHLPQRVSTVVDLLADTLHPARAGHVTDRRIGQTTGDGDDSWAHAHQIKRLHEELITIHAGDTGYTVTISYVEDSTADPATPAQTGPNVVTLPNGDNQIKTGIIEYDHQWNVLEIWTKDQLTAEKPAKQPPDRGLSIAD